MRSPVAARRDYVTGHMSDRVGWTGRTYSRSGAHAERRVPRLFRPPATQAERLAAALGTLNDEQRAAVEHGVEALHGGAPDTADAGRCS